MNKSLPTLPDFLMKKHPSIPGSAALIAILLMLATAQTLFAAKPPPAGPNEDPYALETPAERDARLQWWRDARFGLFIHWNVSSVPAGVYHGKHNRFVGEWLMHDEKIPVAEYREYARRFNPTAFDADEWVQLARDAGVKYIVITAKHHDGFAMYHSTVSDWNIVDATPFDRDPLKELSAACQKHGVKLGFYYSHAQDWVHPGGRVPAGAWDAAQVGDFDEYLRTVAVPQLREILTGYGPVAILWWDAPWEMNRERANLFLPLLKLQPGIITNDRLGGDYPGDAGSPEQGIPEGGLAGGRDWETCMTMNDSWGYKSTDHNWKSPQALIRNLAEIASQGGNYLLNVGPTAEGRIPEPSAVRLRAVGQWLKVNGEAIYATRAGRLGPFPWGLCTRRDDATGTTLYLLVFDWPDDGLLLVPGFKRRVQSACLLADSERRPLDLTPDDAGLYIRVPPDAPD
jgi:alpha-L-fucosidase